MKCIGNRLPILFPSLRRDLFFAANLMNIRKALFIKSNKTKGTYLLINLSDILPNLNKSDRYNTS